MWKYSCRKLLKIFSSVKILAGDTDTRQQGKDKAGAPCLLYGCCMTQGFLPPTIMSLYFAGYSLILGALFNVLKLLQQQQWRCWGRGYLGKNVT